MTCISKSIVEEMTIPDTFETLPERLGGLAMSWLLSCRSRRHQEVEIALFYRGTPNNAESVARFRQLLKAGPALIFDQESRADSDALKCIEEIGAALGNANNNQITNKNSGASGAQFFLQQLEFTLVNNREVMSVTGFFQGPEGEVQSHFTGIYIDASPNDSNRCRIEEIIFQAPDISLFRKYVPEFKEALNTIRWSEKPVANPPSTKDLFKLQF